MKFLKHVIIPLLLGIIMYLLVNKFIFSPINIALFIIYAYLLRIIDDIGDYKKDLLNNKVFLNRWVLIIIGAILAIGYIVLSIITSLYLLFSLVPLVLLLIDKKIFNYFRTLIIPSFIFIYVSVFKSFSIFTYVLMGIVFIFDIVLIILKRRK